MDPLHPRPRLRHQGPAVQHRHRLLRVPAAVPDLPRGWLFAALLIVLIVTAVAHYLNGGIRMSSPRNRVTPQVKAHLSVLLGLLALVKAAGYWLQRYELTVSTRGFVDGAGYTDVNAQLPAINLLLLIMVASFVLFIINIWRRGLDAADPRRRPVGARSRWSPARSTRSSCSGSRWSRTSPRRSSRTSPATSRPPRRRWASATSRSRRSSSRPSPTPSTWPATPTRSGNIRLWDPSDSILGQHVPRSCRASATTTPSTTSTSTATSSTASPPRWCSPCATSTPADIPRKSWAAEHLTYTHGYGAIVAPANEKETSGEPAFVAEDIPYRTARRRARAHPAGRLLRRGPRRLRRRRARSSASSTSRTRTRRSTRPTRARTASRSTTSSRRRRSPSASATSTR